MKVAVFGIGKVFLYYWSYLKNVQVVCLVDNDTEKVGKVVNGIIVISPDELYEKWDFDKVLITSIYYEEIKEQLLNLGIPKDKIFGYFEIAEIMDEPIVVHGLEGNYSLTEWNKKSKRNKKVLLISHEMSYTGAPIALLNMAVIMKKMGFSIIYASQHKGALERELKLEDINYIDNLEWINSRKQKECVEKFDLVVICTVSLYFLVEKYKELNIPILWWIHEAESAYMFVKLFDYGKNVTVFCGGNHARKSFEDFFKGKKAQVLQYCIPDGEIESTYNKIIQRKKICFGIIGTICERKAQDVFLKALCRLPSFYKDQIELIIIGTVLPMDDYWEKQAFLLKKLDNIKLIGEKTQRELTEIYKEIDVLACPSRDDPMPIVVTQAMMYKKVCIISDNVGHVEFIDQGKNGFVFENGNIEQLSEQIKWIVDNRGELQDIGERARIIYEQNFNETIMEQTIKEFWKDKIEKFH